MRALSVICLFYLETVLGGEHLWLLREESLCWFHRDPGSSAGAMDLLKLEQLGVKDENWEFKLTRTLCSMLWRSVLCESSAKLRNGEIQMKDFQFTDKGAQMDFQPRPWQLTYGCMSCVPDLRGWRPSGGWVAQPSQSCRAGSCSGQRLHNPGVCLNIQFSKSLNVLAISLWWPRMGT